jgi:hypothetical protein
VLGWCIWDSHGSLPDFEFNPEVFELTATDKTALILVPSKRGRTQVNHRDSGHQRRLSSNNADPAQNSQ